MPSYLKLAVGAVVAAVAEAGHVYVGSSSALSSTTDVRPTLSETDMSFLLSHLVGTDSPLETKPPTGLPARKVFAQVDATLAIVVTGTDDVELPDNYAAYDYALEREAPSASAAVNSMLTGRTEHHVLTPDLCASADPSIAAACLETNAVLTWDPETQSFDGVVDHGVDDAFFPAVGLQVSDEGVATHFATGTTFDLSDADSRLFFAELAALYHIPESLDTPPTFAVLSMVGPSVIKSRRHNPNVSEAVDMIVASAVPVILEAWNSRFSQDSELLEVVVLRQNGAKRAKWNRDLERAVPRRALQTNSELYTSEETANFQIFTWTWFLLLLVIFFSACSLGGLDIGNDDAGLYSTFKAGSYDRVSHEHEN